MGVVNILFDEIKRSTLPEGLQELIDDIDVDVYLYDEHIMGMASSYLAGIRITTEDIFIDPELSDRLEKCISKLNELLEYKSKVDELAEALINALNK